uniref:hAT-like transposase RNase-H fold domain-containing protein n=1 Tax=Lactuca sativa TaxID=4236 RepID=A0A9R1UX93_LACSA|nr:hypothetical protein LSAT_V11C800414680 [Lactuca sativa]
MVTDGYLSLTTYYVDSKWVLQKRILNFSEFPPPHTGVAIANKLSGLIKNWLKQIDVAVEKVRECVKYVKGSLARKTRFSQCCSENLLDSKKVLMQDVPTRWNSTYMMLSCTLYYRLAFSHLSLSDSNFQDFPSSNEYERVEKMCSFLKVFYDATLQFSGSLYPTSNLYFPQIFGIQLNLVEEKKSLDEYMKK